MFIRVKDKPNGHKAIQIVDTFRMGDQVRQKILKHVGAARNDQELESYRQLAQAILEGLRTQPCLPLPQQQPQVVPRVTSDPGDDRVRMRDLREQSRVIEGIRDILGGVYDELGFGGVLKPSRRDACGDGILRDLVLARLATPASKRKSVEILGRSHGIARSLDQVYRMMDQVAARESEIRDAVGAATLGLFQKGIDVLFFDVTTLYFESFTADELRGFGFSKDCKFKQTQVMLALITTTGGLPITYELFPGNTFEGHTLIPIIELLKKRFEVREILLVADRAMFTRKNLDQMDALGLRYIVAAKLRKLPPALREKILSEPGYLVAQVEDELHWLGEFEHEGRRLISSYSPERAKKDRFDRARLIERLEKKRKGRDSLPVAEVIGNSGTAKFLNIEKAAARLDPKKIANDALWDGMHGVITNVRDMSAVSVLSRYRGLWQIEEAFRINKH
ncbi:IS1634 family transposase, partial [Candidatus Peregrinibacteria bacterium]|nr:IS1634 family transposase [Candidatus Peregrinibacteria bacterium]